MPTKLLLVGRAHCQTLRFNRSRRQRTVAETSHHHLGGIHAHGIEGVEIGLRQIDRRPGRRVRDNGGPDLQLRVGRTRRRRELRNRLGRLNLRFPRQLSPLRPTDVPVAGKGLERERFEELLRASRERNAALGGKRSPDLRKEIAIKVHKSKQSE